MVLLTKRYDDQIDGVLSCYDRVVITGTLPRLCFAQGMTGYLYEQGIRIFDYANFVQPLREQLRLNAQALAKANDIEIEFVRKAPMRKEALVKKVLDKRGTAPGLYAR